MYNSPKSLLTRDLLVNPKTVVNVDLRARVVNATKRHNPHLFEAVTSSALDRA